MINKILEMDKKAREMETKAEENKKHFHTEIEKRKQELYDQYSQSLAEIIEMTKLEQQQLLEDGKKQLDHEMETVSQVMEQLYTRNRAQWIEKITKEVTCND